MATKRDYYEILGVGRDADADTIKKSYRKLAIKYHPDRNKDSGAEDNFKEISEAYAVLSDAEKRQRYDQFGHQGIDGRYSQEDIFGGADFSDIFGGGMGGIFEGLFGGGRRRNPQGQDLLATVRITLEDAYRGAKKEVTYGRQTSCRSCKGNGAEPGTKVETCTSCHGRGQVTQQIRTPFGVMQQVGSCPTCRGQGKRIETHCRTCGGNGKEAERKTIEIDIPAGVETGNRLRVAGAGNAGDVGHASGNLFVEIEVTDHAEFHREGNNLLTELPIHYPLAVLGGKAKLKTFDGELTLDIPAGIQSGKRLRLSQKGMPDLGGRTRGDLYVRIHIATASKPSKKMQELLREMAEELGEDVPSGEGKKRFFDFLRG